jgi:mRNA-degrading endonuclease RelE of RelBE toxin-antitoxin system
MRIVFSKTFEKDYKKLPTKIQKLLDEQLLMLLEDLSYPSLRIKKMQGHNSIWEGRITQNYRFTFEKIDNAYFLRRAGTHPVLNNP